MHLVDHPGEPAQAVHQALGELEAEVEATRADVEQQVAGRRGRDVRAAGEAREGMQARRPRRAEEPVPDPRAHAGHTGEPGLGDAEPDRALEAADVGEHVADLVLAARIDGQDEEDRRLGDRGQDALRLACGHRARSLERACGGGDVDAVDVGQALRLDDPPRAGRLLIR